MNTFAEYEAQEWEFNGMSALTLYRVHQGRAPTRGHHPHDPDDYCRVRQMLRMLFGDNEAAKRSLIQTTADYYDDEVWRRIAAHYDDFMVLWEETKHSDCMLEAYNFISKGDLSWKKENILSSN